MRARSEGRRDATTGDRRFSARRPGTAAMISLTAPHGFVISRVAAAVAARGDLAGRPRIACPTLPAGALSELAAILFEGGGERTPLRALSLLGEAIGAPDGVIGVGTGCEILFADDAA